MIAAIIVDDERAAGQWLGLKLQETGLVDVLHILQNPYEVLSVLKQTIADVVFIDIAMPGVSGLELAEQLSELEHMPEIVFVTAYSDYALEAFRVNALDYVVKPVHDKELQRVLTKLVKRTGGSGPAQAVNSGISLKTAIAIPDAKLDFPTAKSEELFYYLLLKSKQPISKWDIVENLWPGKEPDKGEANIRTTVFRLNQTLARHGLDLRVKASKGSYHFTHASNRHEQVMVQPFPPAEAIHINVAEQTIVDVLQPFNFLQVIEDKDYRWSISLKQHETLFLQWAMKVIDRYRDQEGLQLQALVYLLEWFPLQQSLLLQIMPLLAKLEGSGALSRFYREREDAWKALYDMPLSRPIQQSYEQLLYG